MCDKGCVVPLCRNTSTNSPGKKFLHVPKAPKLRKRWFNAMRRQDGVAASSTIWACEDHFDLEKDLENYVRFSLVGGRMVLRKGVLPHRFDCQKQRTRAHTKRPRPVAERRQRARIVAESIKEFASEVSQQSKRHREDTRVRTMWPLKMEQDGENCSSDMGLVKRELEEREEGVTPKGPLTKRFNFAGATSKCSVCMKPFRASSARTGRKDSKCDNCETALNLEQTSRRVERSHNTDTGINNFKCNICEEPFFHIESLSRHLATHIGQKATKCDICEICAVNPEQSLEINTITHTGKTVFKCNSCELTFCHIEYLTRHLATHTGRKDFKCEVCAKVVCSEPRLKMHMASHVKSEHKCEVCGEFFSRESSLSRHRRLHGVGTDVCADQSDPASEALSLASLPLMNHRTRVKTEDEPLVKKEPFADDLFEVEHHIEGEPRAPPVMEMESFSPETESLQRKIKEEVSD